jgi:MoaA/NifB/PqqE/SkfB family radical SAM enzyme
MKLTGLHILLTYQCTFECDHCFVWGSPWQSGTLTLEQIRRILVQARELGTVEWIYFEGGEPFLYYAVLLQAVREAAGMGFPVGVVSNAYWATSEPDALRWRRWPVWSGSEVSSDLYHYREKLQPEGENPPLRRGIGHTSGHDLGCAA